MQIEGYLSFPGTCEEALNFYTQALGGKVTVMMRYADSPMDDGNLPPEWKNKVLHSTFEAEGGRFMASDTPPHMQKGGHGAITMSIFLPEADKAQKIFNALAEGGQVTMPFAPPFWGGHFGMLTDRFGVPWMVSSQH